MPTNDHQYVCAICHNRYRTEKEATTCCKEYKALAHLTKEHFIAASKAFYLIKEGKKNNG